MRRGEIWDVELPATVGSSGHEQVGVRPAIMVSVEPDPGNPLCMIVPCTSKLNALRFPHTVRVEPSAQNGLTMPTVALVLQLRAQDRNRFIRKRGDLETSSLQEIEDAIRQMMAL